MENVAASVHCCDQFRTLHEFNGDVDVLTKYLGDKVCRSCVASRI